MVDVLGKRWIDLIDYDKSKNPKGGIWPIAELLALNNPILDDAIAVEANSGGSHVHSIRTGLPSVAWGALYKGIPQSKSRRQNVTDTTGFLEGRSAVDTRLVDLDPARVNALRMSEALAFTETMNQEMATGIFYHDTATTPEAFKGLGARYNVIGGGGAGGQVLDAGGRVATDGELTSVWFVTWSEFATHLIYPQGSSAGLKREDKGEQRELDANGDAFYILEEIWRWHIGLSVRDWRYNVRIANIPVDKILDNTFPIYTWMRKAYYKLHGRRLARRGNNIKNGDPTVPMSRTAIYMNTDVLASLDALGTNGGTVDNYVRLVPKDIDGREVDTYRGIPIRETDALINNEEEVPVAA